MATKIVALTNDSKTVGKLVVERDGVVVCEVPINSDEIGDAIQKLANARAALGEPVPDRLDPVVRLAEITSPTWSIPNYTDGGDRLFILRNPALGWISHRFSQAEANEIAHWLTKDVEDRPNRSTASKKPPP